MSIEALEQRRDSVLRYGEVVGCELLSLPDDPQEIPCRDVPRLCSRRRVSRLACLRCSDGKRRRCRRNKGLNSGGHRNVQFRF